VEELEKKIEGKKDEIQKMYLKGTANEDDREKLNEEYKSKFEFYEKKKKILDMQYEKSVNTIHTIKKYLEDIFEEIGIDPDVIDKLSKLLFI
jgi:rubrerythrin